ncbi:unnamed protein product [Coregonus sp. 'balchen']|nr:unnamed protein product [Coregonus sp. 'balchen']
MYLETRGVQLIIGRGSYGSFIGSLVAVVLVLALVVGVYCITKRRTPPQSPDADESPELEYADITIRKKREKQREVPEEVVYGQIVVLEGMETPCDATLDGAHCYGALGGTVSLQLMTIVSGVPDI